MNIFLPEHALIVAAQTICIGQTTRPAVVLLWSANGRPMSLRVGPDQVAHEGRAMLLAPHVARTLHARDCGVVSLNFEPGHPGFHALCALVPDSGLLPLDPQRVVPFAVELERLHGTCPESGELEDLLSSVAQSLAGTRGSSRRDARVDQVLATVEAQLTDPPSVVDLAKAVRLSGDRLSHLFVQQVGLPIRSYVVWRRYRQALRAVRGGRSLAAVAQENGFSDQAHMSRVFSRFFAYQPSRLRSTAGIQIHSQYSSP